MPLPVVDLTHNGLFTCAARIPGNAEMAQLKNALRTERRSSQARLGRINEMTSKAHEAAEALAEERARSAAQAELQVAKIDVLTTELQELQKNYRNDRNGRGN